MTIEVAGASGWRLSTRREGEDSEGGGRGSLK